MFRLEFMLGDDGLGPTRQSGVVLVERAGLIIPI